jgi:hypothetical protein
MVTEVKSHGVLHALTLLALSGFVKGQYSWCNTRGDDRTVYDFPIETLDGERLTDLSSYRGKVLLVINSASL